MIAELEAADRAQLPEDIETLTGDSLALAVGSDFDPEALVQRGGPADIPVGVKIRGDPDEIEKVLDKIREPPPASRRAVLETDDRRRLVVVGPNADYREQLAEDGGLGDTDAYEAVVRERRRGRRVFFVNFDAERRAGSPTWRRRRRRDVDGEPRAARRGLGISRLGRRRRARATRARSGSTTD